jgi:hypothetical protein
MAGPEPDLSLLPEERLQLAIKAFQPSQIANIYATSQLYNVPYTTFNHRLRGRVTRQDTQINNRRLTTAEEKALVQRIISLDNNGFSPTLKFVRGMANLLLQQREPGCKVGKNWLTRWLRGYDELMAKYLRKYNYQRAKCEDSEVLGKWFELVQPTISKYGIVTEDIYNFDVTGFQMGVITTKVLTQTKSSRSKQPHSSYPIESGQPLVNQPGNRY